MAEDRDKRKAGGLVLDCVRVLGSISRLSGVLTSDASTRLGKLRIANDSVRARHLHASAGRAPIDRLSSAVPSFRLLSTFWASVSSIFLRPARPFVLSPPSLPLTSMSAAPTLPTFTTLGVAPPTDVDANQVAQAWVTAFGQAVSARDLDAILGLLHEEPWWRDLWALTWDLRTFRGKDKIRQFLSDRLSVSELGDISLHKAEFVQRLEDMAWIVVQFDFATKVATGRGLAYLVPQKDGQWRAIIVSTNLEDLKGFPERIGALRNPEPNHGKWADQRKREQEFADGDPDVLIIGGGQSGLDIAARLKNLGVSNLIIEKQPRIGNQWRYRYEALCLHDPVCESHHRCL